MAELAVGSQAPNFTCKTDGDATTSLKDFKGKKIVLYFYPKDMTPGCTTEACEFRDTHPDFSKINTLRLSASPKTALNDTINSRKSTSCLLPLPLMKTAKCAKPMVSGRRKRTTARLYMGIVRSTFLIDEKGKIAAVWRNLRVKGHVEKVLEEAQKL